MISPGCILSGVLTDTSGNPVAGTVTMVLCNSKGIPAIAGSSLLSQLSISVQAATNGTFTLPFYGNYQIAAPNVNTYYQIQTQLAGGVNAPLNGTGLTGIYVFTAEGNYDLSTLVPTTVVPANTVPVISPTYVLPGATDFSLGGVMLASGQTSDTLAKVATTGSYFDLLNTIPGLTSDGNNGIDVAGAATVTDLLGEGGLFVTGPTGGASVYAQPNVTSTSDNYGYSEWDVTLVNNNAATPNITLFGFGSEGEYTSSGTLTESDFYVFNYVQSKYNLIILGSGAVGLGQVSNSSLTSASLYISPSGEVAIGGSVTPGYTLDVGGHVNATEYFISGVPLTPLTSLTTSGTSGVATLTSGVLNVPAYVSAPSRVDNTHGSYLQFADGTLFQWGTVTPSGGGDQTITVTFPTAFTSTTNLIVNATVANGADNITTNISGNPSTSGCSLTLGSYVRTGGSGTTPSGSEVIHWSARGH